MNKINTKRIILLSILASCAICLSYFDRIISGVAFSFLPQAKIGLANIVILLAIYHFDFKECFILVIIKATIGNLIGSGFTAVIIGGSASIVSFFSMYLLFKNFKNYISAVGISVVGGFLHIITQLFITGTFYVTVGEVLLYYGAGLVILSLITSVIIGFIVNRLNTSQFIKAF